MVAGDQIGTESAEHDTIGVISLPLVLLSGAGQVVLDTVDPDATRRGRKGLGRQGHQPRDDLIPLKLLTPIAKQGLGLSEDVSRVLVGFSLRSDNCVTCPLDADPHSVVIDLLFVAHECASGNSWAIESSDERDIHILAARLQFAPNPDDRSETLVHVGREHVLTHELPVDLPSKPYQFIIGISY